MAWNLKGSYVETCSCELMCPCNLSLDHGATYDFCRVTLVFNIREGQVEGTDISGLKVAAIADTPKVMTEGNWRLGVQPHRVGLTHLFVTPNPSPANAHFQLRDYMAWYNRLAEFLQALRVQSLKV